MNPHAFKAAYDESRNGCSLFLRHPLGRALRYSDGVQECADAGAHWLLDIIATEVAPLFRNAPDPFGVFHAVVHNGKAKLHLSFVDDAPPAWRKSISYTDMPDGDWSFYLCNEGEDDHLDVAMVLPTEN